MNFKKLEKKDISNADIKQMLKGRVNVIPYHSIPLKPDFLGYFNKNGKRVPLVLLYEQFRNVGHFVVLQLKQDHIEYFDPLGFRIDAILKLWSEKTPHWLSMALDRSKLPVISNHRRVQNFSMDTCGRHCVARVLYNEEYPQIEDYVDFLLQHSDPDLFVTELSQKVK